MTNNIYKGVKPTRQMLQVPQMELARRMKRNQAHLSGIETGKRHGSITYFEDMCNAMDVPFVVVAMEALQAEEIRGSEMEEFLAIKEQLYRFLGVEKVLKEKMEVNKGREIAERLWKAKQAKQLERNLALQKTM